MKIKNIYFISRLIRVFFNTSYVKGQILTIPFKLTESACDDDCKL